MIKKKDFDKLKQNDRIEYLLRLNRLEKREQSLSSGWVGLIYILLSVIAFIILLSLQLKILGYEEAFITIFYLLKPLTTIMVFVILFGGIWDLMRWFIISPLWDKKLDSEFITYKTEIKNKK